MTRSRSGAVTISKWIGVEALNHSRLQEHYGNVSGCHVASVQARRRSISMPQDGPKRVTLCKTSRKSNLENSGALSLIHSQAALRLHGCIGSALGGCSHAGPKQDEGKSMEDQDHQPFNFSGGTFSDTSFM